MPFFVDNFFSQHLPSTPGTPSVDKLPCGLRLLPLGCYELNYKHYGKTKQHENNTLP